MQHDEVLSAVEARLITTLGEPDARAAVTFLGTDRIEVLRFLGDDAGGGAAAAASAVVVGDVCTGLLGVRPE